MSQNLVETKHRSRLPWVLMALVVAVIAGVTLYRQFHSSADTAKLSQSVDEESDGRKGAARRLTPEEIRALATRSPGLQGGATVSDMAGMMEKRKRMAEATQARTRERNAAFAARFAAEKSDPSWSPAHEKELASLQDSDPMRDADAKATNFRADCRSTTCRIQADFPDSSAAADWLQLYMGSVGDRLPVATAHKVTNPDGSVRVEIYGVGRTR
ncbi:MAG: hypothetical protein QM719_00420 [Thermomonas sp.]